VDETHDCVVQEPRLVFLRRVWPPRHIPDVLNIALTVFGARNLRHGPLARRVRGLWYLEGTSHDKDDLPALDGANATRSVRASLA
jgi:hypothetical protein